MKVNTTMKHSKTVNFVWIIVAIFMITAVSCSSTSGKSENKTEEMQDAKTEVADGLQQEKEDALSKVDSIIADFNAQISTLELAVDSSTVIVDSAMSEIADKLKADRDSLLVLKEEITLQTEQSWSEFKTELDQDAKQFANSVNDFFVENE